MTIRTATRAGGDDNQDRYVVGGGVATGFAAVLDGATSVAGNRSHDPGWYAERLAEALAVTVPRGDALAEAVVEAIRSVRDAHGLHPETTPTSTVAVARWSPETVETYLLCDSFVVVLRDDGTETVRTDDRLDGVATAERATYRRRLAAGSGYDDEHRAVLIELQAEQARRVNRPGGYWIAGADPEAGREGLTTVEPRAGISALLLASDGVDPARHPTATTWRGLGGLVEEDGGPDGAAGGGTADGGTAGGGAARVLDQLHDAEADDPDGRRWPRSKRHDDKTLVVVPLV